VVPDVGWVLAGLVLALGVAVSLLIDERKAALERSLLRELREVQAVNQELWDGLGPERYKEIVSIYVRMRETYVRANFIIEFWNKAGKAYADRRVNRARFIKRVAAKCDGLWRDYSDLVGYLQQCDPQRIAGWRRLQRAAGRELERTLKQIEKIKTPKAA
jgi:hypothetical protein